ncbi:MAG: hypothetical protein IJW50_05700 [Clostridia bacterium]|nr:hypothetical protein [Clostridia bacterium]
MESVTDLAKSCARNARRGEFAKQICASVATQARLGSDSRHPLSFLESVTDLAKSCARNACRGEFAKQICASIATQARLGSDSRHAPPPRKLLKKLYQNF